VVGWQDGRQRNDACVCKPVAVQSAPAYRTALPLIRHDCIDYAGIWPLARTCGPHALACGAQFFTSYGRLWRRGLYGLQNRVCGRWTPDAGCWTLHSGTSSGPATPTSNILPCPQQCAPEIRQASLLLSFVIQEHIGAARPITSRSSPPRFVQHMGTVRTGSVGRCS
jgi:hypothetical protein